MSNSTNLRIEMALHELQRTFNECVNCAVHFSLQFAHIEPTGLNGTGRGRKERYYDIIKNPDKYTRLCKRCHTMYDGGDQNVKHVSLMEWIEQNVA